MFLDDQATIILNRILYVGVKVFIALLLFKLKAKINHRVGKTILVEGQNITEKSLMLEETRTNHLFALVIRSKATEKKILDLVFCV